MNAAATAALDDSDISGWAVPAWLAAHAAALVVSSESGVGWVTNALAEAERVVFLVERNQR